MSGSTFQRRALAGRVRPAILALLVVVQVLSNLAFPGFGLAFLPLLAWRRARSTKWFGVALVIVAAVSTVLLAGMILDATTGPSVGSDLG